MRLQDFFAINRDLIIFLYGQVFFVLGLAIALQSRRYSRLDLARSLPWLAAFGIVHGIFEWGDILIPSQAELIGQSGQRLMAAFYLGLLALSFACLFAFGVSLMRSFIAPRAYKSASWIPWGVLIGWLAVAGFALPLLVGDFVEWLRAANALARYFIGLPGALLAAYALRRQAMERVAPLGVPEIVNALRVAGIALASYAIFGGLIVPTSPFPPAIWLNNSVFEQYFGVPVIICRAVAGLVLLIAIVRALEVFEVETTRRIDAMEQQQILAAERSRIGRDLHDGAIQMVYTAGLLVESASRLAPPDTPLSSRLERAMIVLKDAVVALRHNLGELREPSAQTSLNDGLAQLAADPRIASLVSVSLRVEQLPQNSLSPVRADHVLSIVNEALSNVLRHARASRVVIEAECANNRLLLRVQDDGIGLPKDASPGFGVRNMRDRARLLGGQLDITAGQRHGTIVSLDIPWSDEQ
jgi:signal transduction histidine kinase